MTLLHSSLHEMSDKVDWQRENDGRVLFGTDAGQGLQVTQLQKLKSFYWENEPLFKDTLKFATVRCCKYATS